MIDFVAVALKNRTQVGSVCPSSPALSKALARGVRGRHGPKRVLEVGPGTGPVTRHILASLRPGDTFDLVELSPEFCRQLERRVLTPWRQRNPGIQVRLYQAPIQEAPLEPGTYDAIVSGLPFNNFKVELVREITDRLFHLLKPGGELAYFGYAGVKTIKSGLVGPDGRRNLRAIAQHERDLLRRHNGHKQLVLANIPPAAVLRLSKS